MATTYKNAQVAGSGNITTYSTLYNTGASSTAVISSLVVTNTGTEPETYRVGIVGSDTDPSSPNWVVYDAVVTGNDTVALTLGITLGTTQYLKVSASSTDVNIHAFISEII